MRPELSATAPVDKAFLGYSDIGEAGTPPWQVTEARFLIIGLTWPEAVIRSFLPDELTPTPDFRGIAYIFGSDQPGPLSPYSCCFLAIEVEGHDSPDGSRAYYIVTGHISRRGEAVRRQINANFLPGGSRQWAEGDVLAGAGGPAGADGMRMRLRPTGEVAYGTNGVHNFIGSDPAGGGLQVYSVAFTGDFEVAEPLALDILDDASEQMRPLRPRALTWGLRAPGLTVTYSPPRKIGDRAAIQNEAARVTLLEVFSHLGKPAVVADRDLKVRYATRQAEALRGDGGLLHGDLLRCRRPEDQAALREIVAAASDRAEGAFDLPPIAIELPDGARLLARAMPLDPTLTGGPAALLLFSDPARPARGNTARSLQLLGLTPAEARIAALVGAGEPPRKAAAALGITEHTIRSSLKVIYDKLAVNKQTELAGIVARLEGVG